MILDNRKILEIKFLNNKYVGIPFRIICNLLSTACARYWEITSTKQLIDMGKEKHFTSNSTKKILKNDKKISVATWA